MKIRTLGRTKFLAVLREEKETHTLIKSSEKENEMRIKYLQTNTKISFLLQSKECYLAKFFQEKDFQSQLMLNTWEVLAHMIFIKTSTRKYRPRKSLTIISLLKRVGKLKRERTGLTLELIKLLNKHTRELSKHLLLGILLRLNESFSLTESKEKIKVQVLELMNKKLMF